MQFRAFVRAQKTIRHKGAFHCRDIVLLGHQAAVFPACDGAAMKAMLDARQLFALAGANFV